MVKRLPVPRAKRTSCATSTTSCADKSQSKKRKMTNGVQLVANFGGSGGLATSSTTVIQQPYTIHMNNAFMKAAYGQQRPNLLPTNHKSAKETLLEQAHREYQLGDYQNAELHCKQVI